MLSKKAQLEDNIEILLSVLGVIIGVVVLTILKAEYGASVNNAKAGLQAGDVEGTFIATDLHNLLKMPIDSYTFGEIIAYMPRNYQDAQDPSLFEGILWDRWLVDGLSCNTELYQKINGHLNPVYGKYWKVKVFYQDKEIFSCFPPELTYEYGGPKTATMILPTLNFEEEVRVLLEVYR